MMTEVITSIVVRAQTITQGIRGAFASVFGGNIKAYEEVCEQARSEAFGITWMRSRG